MRTSLVLALACCLTACKPDGSSPPIDAEHQHSLELLESPERNAWAKPDEVVAALPLTRPDMDVADIGAGSGYFTRRIARRVPDGTVFAVDVDGTYKHYIKDHCEQWGTPNIETRLALYENPLLPQDSLDLVFLSNTYRYIQQRTQYFGGVNASLRSGGKLVIVDFDAARDCSPIGEDCPPKEQRITAEAVESELREAGFVLESRADFLPYQYMLVFARQADASNHDATGESESGSK